VEPRPWGVERFFSREILVSAIRGVVTFLLFALNTLFWAVPLYLLAIPKRLSKDPARRQKLTVGIEKVCFTWYDCNSWLLKTTTPIEWDVQIPDDLSQEGWYLLTSNHQSWVDIIVLLDTLYRDVPFPRFFIKKQLLKVPVLGTAWAALDFPAMERYTKEFLEQNPHLRGKDLETTRKACELYQHKPVSIINYIEGTRFTQAKHDNQQSPYRHLLRPRAGGIAFVLSAMDGRIHTLLDLTIVYPGGVPTFWDLLSGRMKKVIVRTAEREIPEDLLRGDYMNDNDYRERVQAWVTRIWEEKDALIDELKGGAQAKTARAA
jgi:1-acyl-sn-glycerol-3-phosphate acyltransferase